MINTLREAFFCLPFGVTMFHVAFCRLERQGTNSCYGRSALGWFPWCGLRVVTWWCPLFVALML